MNYALVLCLISFATFCSAKSPCLGCENSASVKDLRDAETSLKAALKALSKTETGPFYKLEEITSATLQATNGLQYNIKAKLKDTKTKTEADCNVKLNDEESQPLEVAIKCPGKRRVVKHVSHSELN